jgi:hypothetical protein
LASCGNCCADLSHCYGSRSRAFSSIRVIRVIRGSTSGFGSLGHGLPSAGSARNQRRALGSAAKGLRLGSAVALLRGVTFAPQLGQRPPPVECARQSPAFCGTPTPLSSARMARAQPASQSGVAVARPGGRPCHTHSTWRRSRAPRQHWGTDGAQRLRRAARAETCQENEVLTDSSTEVTDME